MMIYFCVAIKNRGNCPEFIVRFSVGGKSEKWWCPEIYEIFDKDLSHQYYHTVTIITPGDADLIDDPIQLLADILPSDFQCIHFWPSVRRNIMTSGFSVQIVQQSGNYPDSLESSWPIHIPTGPWIKLSPRVCTRLERDGWKCRCGEVSPRYENCLMKRVKWQLYDR